MKEIIVKRNNSSLRIDKFLVKEFFSYTRGEVIRQIRNGNALINGKKVKPSYILKENDKLEINLEETERGLVPNKKIKPEIIFENENIIIVNKPSGLRVHPDNHEKNNALVNALVAKYPEIKNVGEDLMRPGIVHRLDKDTSGVMIVARNQKTFKEIKKKFQDRKIEKKYWAIVYGQPAEKKGLINKPLARAATYKKQVIAGKKTETKIREAVTHYKVLRSWNNFSLLEMTPKTGRMHQIRVHLTSIGHPIVGDKIYKSKAIQTIGAYRQMLHAKSIKFESGGEGYFFEANPPEDFEKFLRIDKIGGKS